MTTKQQRLEAEIARGDHDAYLVHLGSAIEARVRSAEGPSVKWAVSYNGQTLTAESVTLGEFRFIESVTRVPSMAFNPLLLDGHKMAAVAVLIARGGVDRDVAWEQADSVPASSVTAEEYQVDADPLAAA